MNATIKQYALLITACLFAPFAGHGYEQDNWYLHGPIDGNLTGVFHQEYDSVNKRDLLYKSVGGVGLKFRDINGTLIEVMNTGGTTFTDIEFNQTTSRLFGINGSRLTCFEQNATYDWRNSGGPPKRSLRWLRHQMGNYTVPIMETKSMCLNRMEP